MRWSLIVGAVTGLGAVLFAVAGPFFVDWIFGEGYDAAVPAITWCVVAAVPYSMSTLLAVWSLRRRRRKSCVPRGERSPRSCFSRSYLRFQTPSPEQAAIALAVSRGVGLAAYAVLFVAALRKRMEAVGDGRSQLSTLDEQ